MSCTAVTPMAMYGVKSVSTVVFLWWGHMLFPTPPNQDNERLVDANATTRRPQFVSSTISFDLKPRHYVCNLVGCVSFREVG